MYFGQQTDSEPILESVFIPDSSQGLVGIGGGWGGSGQSGVTEGLEYLFWIPLDDDTTTNSNNNKSESLMYLHQNGRVKMSYTLLRDDDPGASGIFQIANGSLEQGCVKSRL